MSIAEKLRKLLDIKGAIKEALFFVGQEVADKMEDWAMAIRNICNVPFENLGYDDELSSMYKTTFRRAYINGKKLKDYLDNYNGVINTARALQNALGWDSSIIQDYIFFPQSDKLQGYNITGPNGILSMPVITEKLLYYNNNFTRRIWRQNSPIIKITAPITNYGSGNNDLSLLKYIELDAQYITDNIQISSAVGQMYLLRVVKIKGLGTINTSTNLDIKVQHSVGVNNDEFPNARQDLVDSLLTNSFDRAAAGYSVFTITLSQETFNLLTEEEITAITAKGYTLVV